MGIAFIAAGSLMLAACGGGSGDAGPPGDPNDDRNALSLAIAFRGGDFTQVPESGQEYPCTIEVAIQPPAPQSPFHPVEATCEWTVEKAGDVWLATFRESWHCEDFSASGAGFPECIPPLGFHEWIYQVDLKGGGGSTEISSRGQFAPDMRPTEP
jgi:hypothetical protein